MPKQGEGMTLGNTEEKFVFLTTHKTVTHKLFDSPRSYFCIVTACAGGHTTTGRLSSFTNWIIIILIIMICDPYFFWYAEAWKIATRFWLQVRSQVSFLVQWLKLKLVARISECNIQFPIMLFESLSHPYFPNGITCVAMQLVANCFS